MSSAAPRLILASASPRRRHLLADAGFEFEIVAPKVDEIFSDHFTLREGTAWNALRKGLCVARRRPECVVLAADTLVALDREIIGKPADRAEAARILRRLSGQTHYVATGVFLAHLQTGRSLSFSVISRVVFKSLSEDAIENYLDLIDPLDKAGAYAAQDKGRVVIERIIGSESNVIGLPMEKTRAALARFGLRPPPARRA